VSSAAKKYHHYISSKKLLKVPFTSVREYLFLLRDISCALAARGPEVIFYLAAAVSDFYIPISKMVLVPLGSAA